MSTDKAMVTDAMVDAAVSALDITVYGKDTKEKMRKAISAAIYANRSCGGFSPAALSEAEQQPVEPLGKGWNETDGYDRVYIQFAKWRHTGQTQVHRSSLFPFDGGQEYVRASHRSDQLRRAALEASHE